MRSEKKGLRDIMHVGKGVQVVIKAPQALYGLKRIAYGDRIFVFIISIWLIKFSSASNHPSITNWDNYFLLENYHLPNPIIFHHKCGCMPLTSHSYPRLWLVRWLYRGLQRSRGWANGGGVLCELSIVWLSNLGGWYRGDWLIVLVRSDLWFAYFENKS